MENDERNDENLGKWKTVRIRQELLDDVRKEVERSEHKGLSEFVSEALRNRLQELAKQRVTEYLERDKAARIPQPLYSTQHMWAQATSEGHVEVGVTEHFQKLLKEITYIRTDKAGVEVSKNEPFGVAESWWFTYDLYSPLNGKIIAVNEKITEDPLSLNADPSTWIVKVQPENPKTWADDMLSPREYYELIGSSQ